MLKGTGIALRPVAETDLEELHRRKLDTDETGPWWPVPTQSLSKLRAMFAESSGLWSPDLGAFLIVDDTDRKLGYLNYGKIEGLGYDIELGYRIFDPAMMGRGIMTQAVMLMSDYLFEWQPVHRLVIYTHADNVPSIRVAEKAGYTREGTLRSVWYNRGEWCDVTVFSMLRDERPAARRARNAVPEPRVAVVAGG